MAAVVLVAIVSGCTEDRERAAADIGSAPRDAPVAEFCDLQAETFEVADNATRDQAQEVAAFGTPTSFSDEARRGWERLTSYLLTTEVDNPLRGVGMDDFPDQDARDLAAFLEAMFVTCPGVYPEPVEGRLPTNDEFCNVYSDYRDVPSARGAEAAEHLADVGLPFDLQPDSQSGFGLYRTFVDELSTVPSSYQIDRRYQLLEREENQRLVLSFVRAADDLCGTTVSSDGPTDADRGAYCDVFGRSYATKAAVADLEAVGTPDFGDGSLVARRGFEVYVERYPTLTPAQRRSLDTADDYRRVFGMTDQAFVDSWLLWSVGMCRSR